MLISGPLRTFEEVWLHNLEILKGLNIDFNCFIHTWEESIPTYKVPMNGYLGWPWQWKRLKYEEQYNSSVTSLTSKEVFKDIHVENFNEFSEQLSFLNKYKNENFYQALINSMSMYYGMFRVTQQTKKVNMEFSHAIRLRPDFKLPNQFQISVDENIVFHGGGVSIQGKMVSDQCFSGGYNQMCEIMSIFPELFSYMSSADLNHEYIFSTIAENSIYMQLKKFDLLEKSVMRPEPQLGLVIRPKVVENSNISHLNFYIKGLNRKKLIIKKKTYKILLYIKYRIVKK